MLRQDADLVFSVAAHRGDAPNLPDRHPRAYTYARSRPRGGAGSPADLAAFPRLPSARGSRAVGATESTRWGATPLPAPARSGAWWPGAT
ncbi:hypothetical protein GCM10010412_052540 [Nonomuraea recticatena]|uniref:Uncharacterized protein n=1 Tax=Nonomuraea recticatena TaxID=46178 RepID=A0ABN3SCT4_9ACTN